MIAPPCPDPESDRSERPDGQHPHRPVVRRGDHFACDSVANPLRPLGSISDEHECDGDRAPQQETGRDSPEASWPACITPNEANKSPGILNMEEPGRLAQPVLADAREPAQQGIGGGPAARHSNCCKGYQASNDCANQPYEPSSNQVDRPQQFPYDRHARHPGIRIFGFRLDGACVDLRGMQECPAHSRYDRGVVRGLLFIIGSPISGIVMSISRQVQPAGPWSKLVLRSLLP